ncbi:MAG: acetoacetate--CoA ligase [Pseudomonadota bacterium]
MKPDQNHSSNVLWQPSDEMIAQSQMTTFARQLEVQYNTTLNGYHELHQWGLDNPALLWDTIWTFCDIQGQKTGPTTSESDNPWGVHWFPEAKLNFAENLLRFRDQQTALIGLLETGQRSSWTYEALFEAVASLASAMRGHGVQPGDRVVGLLPNIPETVIAMLATTSIGAIWSSCSPDFGAKGAIDRFRQIEPKLLFTTDGYVYGGKRIALFEKVADIARSIESIESVIVIPLLDGVPSVPQGMVSLAAFTSSSPAQPLEFAQLPFNHPLYIMYSSGTTGTPKCIVHGAGGTLLQHVKEQRLHLDLNRKDVFFYFTTCGWMMWNWLVSGLASGCTLVLFDGSPFANDGNILLDAIDSEGITVFGTSAKYIAQLEKIDKTPTHSHQLTSLRTILSTGSPLNHSSFEYVYRDFKQDVHLASISGGTDIISCFALGNPNLPVRTGELQCAGLGMAVAFYLEDTPAPVGVQGELVCTQPFPCTPVGFWNDSDDSRFKAAYFDQRPGIWTHGDFGEVTQSGGIIIHGRSDATLNPSGVRIGTAEIYRQIEALHEVIEGIVVGQSWEGDERVVLFVVLAPNHELDEALISKIKHAIRSNTTPRHVPAKVLQVPDIPRTMSGKIVELAVRDTINGRDVSNLASLANPDALDYFKNREELKT